MKMLVSASTTLSADSIRFHAAISRAERPVQTGFGKDAQLGAVRRGAWRE